MTFAKACFQRFAPLLQALCLNVDVGLDLRQAVVYREYALDKNGTYHRWAINNTDSSTNYIQTISHGYFQAWCVIFFLSPLFLTLFSIFCGIIGIGSDWEPDAFHEHVSRAKMILRKCKIEINTERGGNCMGLVCHPLLFLMEYLILCLTYNLLSPLIARSHAFSLIITYLEICLFSL